MAMTPEQSKQDQEDFKAAFNGAEQAAPEPSEDAAFGLDAQEDDGGTEEPTEASQMMDAESSADGQTGEQMHGSPAIALVIEPPAEAEVGAPADGPTDPKDIQREKSWEGRLKAKEAELKAREEALGKTPEMAAEGETPAQEAAEPGMTEALEQAVAQVESGELTADQAMKALANDFGPDFTKMLDVLISAKAGEIASKTADERIGTVDQKMQGIVSEIADDKKRQHFESIADAHPDFAEVAASPEFKSYIDGMDEAAKASAMQVIQEGSWRQIIGLLNSYKKAGQGDAGQESAMDAAEGVRSNAVKLPKKPAESQDYAEAWASF